MFQHYSTDKLSLQVVDRKPGVVHELRQDVVEIGLYAQVRLALVYHLTTRQGSYVIAEPLELLYQPDRRHARHVSVEIESN
jgi:hypothetical protein